MKNLKRVLHTVERQVVDSSGWRSQPKTARVSLPYLRILDDSMGTDPDRLAGRGRVGSGY
jgi:hypothetical protein